MDFLKAFLESAAQEFGGKMQFPSWMESSGSFSPFFSGSRFWIKYHFDRALLRCWRSYSGAKQTAQQKSVLNAVNSLRIIVKK